MKMLKGVLSGLSIGLLLATVNFTAANESVPRREKRAQQQVEIKVVPWGLTQAEIDAAKLRVTRSAEVQKELANTKHRLLEFSYIENESKSRGAQPPTRFRVVFYDYTNDRTLIAEGDFAASEAIRVREDSYQPTANGEEFNEALRILQQNDKQLSALLRSETLRAFPPMPPITVLEGTKERLINIGLAASSDAAQNEIVSVSIGRSSVVRYAERAPVAAEAEVDSCGPPNAAQSPSGRGLAGQYQMTVSQNGVTLWEMLVIRPSASSGTQGSGIEVRDVRYKGKSVLKRGQVPVLNVQYVNGACGPFRDWQYAEGYLSAPSEGATDPAPGFRVLAPGKVATTIVETGVDQGNYRGVAVYTQDVGAGMETVMVSELDAGWYRYIMEWRFANDGTIRPRFGFGATFNSCVCHIHTHNAYWRLDFDIVNPNNKVFQVERGRKFLQPQMTEFVRNKNVQTNRSFLIQNATGDEAYMLVPSRTDGVADAYAVNDVWVTRYKNVPGGTPLQNEIDDGETCIGCSNTTGPVRFSQFVNNESINNQDVVLWYGAHFIHADGANLLNPDRSPTVLTGTHVIGPDIRPVRW